MKLVSLCLASSSLLSVSAWTPQSAQPVSRANFLGGVAAASAAVLLSQQPALAETLPNGVSYTVKKSGSGVKPEIGDLIAIRFAAYAGDNKIDDIFDTPEPYYTRVGSGALIKGVEQILPEMKVGDRWVLTVPGELAFGPKGRPASAGKPRIGPNAEIIFDVEVVGLPGKEVELIELIGDN